jgi:hypothetical protein
MLTAAKEGTFSASSDPCVFFPLAASEGVPKNSRLGFARKNPAPHQGSAWSNSGMALGIQEVVWEICGGSDDGARYYDPQAGRFLSEDPVGFAGGSNFYSYVDGDSTSLVDLFGLQGTGTATAPAPVTAPAQPVVSQPEPPVPSNPVISPQPPTSSIGRIIGNLLDDALDLAGDVAGAGAITLLSPVNAGGPGDMQPDPSVTHGPPCKNGCKPCIPPVGTRAYREDTNPNSPAHRGIPTPHWHLYEMHQNPNNCQCFWKPVPDNQGGFGPSPPPAGIQPIGPAGGGGPN